MSHFENLAVSTNFGSSFMDYQIKLMTAQQLLCRDRYKTLLVIHTCTKFLIDLSQKTVLLYSYHQEVLQSIAIDALFTMKCLVLEY